MLARPKSMAVSARRRTVTTSSWPCGVRHLDAASCSRRCAMEYRREKFSRTMGKGASLLRKGRPNNASGREREANPSDEGREAWLHRHQEPRDRLFVLGLFLIRHSCCETIGHPM